MNSAVKMEPEYLSERNVVEDQGELWQVLNYVHAFGVASTISTGHTHHSL